MGLFARSADKTRQVQLHQKAALMQNDCVDLVLHAAKDGRIGCYGMFMSPAHTPKTRIKWTATTRKKYGSQATLRDPIF